METPTRAVQTLTPLKAFPIRTPKTPLRTPLSVRKLNTPFSPNDDEQERAKAREKKSKLKMQAFLTPNSKKATNIDSDVIGLSEAQMSELYQNCIKLAAENKINQKNSWDLPLIDHLGDIIKSAKKGDSQQNFQKASCTLEAGVKIYSYRVDSVHSETLKVLGGLNRTTGEQEDEGQREGAEVNEEGSEVNEGVGKSRKKEQREKADLSATLASSWESLNCKKLEVAFAVDPLFHQTTAQFDEGGVKGLLLHNLSVFRDYEILFDSEEAPQKIMTEQKPLQGSPSSVIDLSFLESEVVDLMKAIPKKPPITPSLGNILQHLSDLRRKEAELELEKSEKTMFSEEDEEASETWGNEPTDVVSGLTNDNDLNLNFGDNDDGFENDDDAEEDFGEVFGGNEFLGEVKGRTFEHEDDLGDGEIEELLTQGDEPADVTRWLAAGLGLAEIPNAWAGPQHWKYKSQSDEAAAKGERLPKAKKEKGEALLIDFFNIPEDIQSPQPVKDLKKISLTKIAINTPANTLLPIDYKYSSEHFDRLFLRPWGLWAKLRKGTIQNGELGGGNYEGFGENGGDSEDEGNENFGGFGDENYGGFGDGKFGDSEEVNDNSDLIEQPRQVTKTRVNYAQTSKQVDVKVLKETLWDHLQEKNQEKDDSHLNKEKVEPVLDKQGISFQNLLESFPEDCLAAPLEDISVHLCFICMLHLANEHNLEIQGTEDLNDLQIIQPHADI